MAEPAPVPSGEASARAARPRAVRVLAPAKVNVGLWVLGRRADGFHELATWMLAIEPCDVLTLEPRADAALSLAVTGPHASADVPEDASNLAVRAVRATLDALDERELGVHVTLEKRVPSGAGLGGASADAAAAVRAVEALVARALGATRRRALVAALGSDCTFFAEAASTGAALCEGRGESVTRVVAAPRAWRVAVITPRVHAPTTAVYAALGSPLSAAAPAHTVRRDPFERAATQARALLVNHLEEAAMRAFPELRAWRRVLDASGAAHFRLSGSGSSFVGLFDDADEAAAALERLGRAVAAARLDARAAWVAEPTGHGVRLAEAEGLR